jgi:copper(I)-binding protein
MLMGLKHDLKPGEKVPVTLKFEHAGEVRVEAAVR